MKYCIARKQKLPKIWSRRRLVPLLMSWVAKVPSKIKAGRDKREAFFRFRWKKHASEDTSEFGTCYGYHYLCSQFGTYLEFSF